jgi:hypothetical protein
MLLHQYRTYYYFLSKYDLYNNFFIISCFLWLIHFYHILRWTLLNDHFYLLTIILIIKWRRIHNGSSVIFSQKLMNFWYFPSLIKTFNLNDYRIITYTLYHFIILIIWIKFIKKCMFSWCIFNIIKSIISLMC